ncbi:hypothetical protein P3551_21000 [Vibrio parahaemolyticus]|uniref:hypothetical protein n=1 Tax=Vibrio parahaemolyticus TaxID=670 RepID=UPI00111EBC0A|nr:hypothetical protein [Vibrio parahaemolyticus]MBE3985677.1 hypothetical protein [Vibrio parahaemolyticus]MBE4286452.1 hypothetical protein [Vibrio parahaemolyticus]MDF4901760.1 hypothetical protein [Vibrio parahaemolyticus]TOH18944.1 hypothetical protein CGI90_04295 [Vibrio parahaemolyticus]HCG7330492.1 hypothetical protein [Vibrio parahaemolyticus]
MSKEYFLVQKVVVKDEEMLVEHIKEFVFIENGSMDGNKLLMKVLDSTAVYRDDFGIKRGTKITVTLADWNNKGDQVWIERFIVAKAAMVDGFLQIEAFEQTIHYLKQQVDKPRFFTNKQPKEILAELVPHLKINCDDFDRGATYHLNSGGTQSRMIRAMARDYGAMCFVSRGVMNFKSIKNIPMEKEFKLEHSNPIKADHTIARYQIIGEEGLFERVLNREYVDWNIVEGIQRYGSGAKVMVSVPQEKALKNQNVSIIPILDIELNGFTTFMPMKVCEVLFHKQIDAQELDESIPDKQIITQAVHYQADNKYQCRLELGVKNL